MILLQAPAPEPAVGDRAPDVVFYRASGEPLPLRSLRGKVVVLEFTSEHCPPCRLLEPKLEAFAAKRPDVVFLSVSVDSPGAFAKLAALRRKGARNELVQDRYFEDRSKMAVWRFGNPGTPAMFVVGRDQKMASRLMLQGAEDLPHLAERVRWARKRP